MLSSPIPSVQCYALVLATYRNNKHTNFEWRGQGRGADSLFSEVTLVKYNVSTILSLIVAIMFSFLILCFNYSLLSFVLLELCCVVVS